MSHSKLRRLATAATAMACLLALGACSNSGDSDGASGGSTHLVKVAMAMTAKFAPFYNGVDKGFFKDAGLDVKIMPQSSPIEAASTVQSGAAQFGMLTLPVIVNLAAKGIKMQCAATVNGNIWSNTTKQSSLALVASAKSGIKDYADLTGHKVGVLDYGSINYLQTRKLAADAGATDVEYVTLPFPQMVQALESGQVDAIVVTDPFLQEAMALHPKPTLVGNPNAEVDADDMIWCFAGTADYLKQNPEVGQAFQDAAAKSVVYAKDHQDEAKLSLVDHMKLSKAVALKQVIDSDFDPTLKPESFTKVINLMKTYGQLDKDFSVDVNDLIWTPKEN